MTRRASLLLAVVAALLVILAVSASAAVPRCDQDGEHTVTEAHPTATEGHLSYNNNTACADGEQGTIDVVERAGSAGVIAKMGDWKYFVGMRSAGEVVYTLNAKCGDAVVCQAQVSYSTSA